MATKTPHLDVFKIDVIKVASAKDKKAVAKNQMKTAGYSN